MSLFSRKPDVGVSDTNRAVQPKKVARKLTFRKYEVKEFYYLCWENKGADELSGYMYYAAEFFLVFVY